MESTLFGLPAHPLLVHAVVVLIPLAGIAMVVMVLVPRTRSHLVWATLLVAIAAAALTPWAAESGEELAHQVDETAALENHEGLGENLTPFAVALAIGAAGLAAEHVLADRRSNDFGMSARRRWVPITVAGVALVTAVAGTAQVVAVGHSGAEATWEGVTMGD